MENKFWGNGWVFPPEFAANGNYVSMVSGEEDIRQSLQIILSTSLRERLMHPDFGCDLNQFLFEPLDSKLESNIASMISRSLLMHEPRIKVDQVSVQAVNLDDAIIQISIDYTVRMTNNRFNLVYPFYVNEASLSALNL